MDFLRMSIWRADVFMSAAKCKSKYQSFLYLYFIKLSFFVISFSSTICKSINGISRLKKTRFKNGKKEF